MAFCCVGCLCGFELCELSLSLSAAEAAAAPVTKTNILIALGKRVARD